MRQTASFAAICCSLGLFLIGASPAGATVIAASENPKLFGNLNQADTACPDVACGPTAAVNSFIYLQNEFPHVYDHKLVPAATKTTSQYQQMINVANSLGTNDYMNTCGCGGTFIEEFIAGKQKYIDAMAAGTTTYAAQMTSNTWRNMPGKVNVGPQPAYVQLNTAPTIQFLADQLRSGEDVELFINGGPGGSNHYVTLTKIFYNDAKGGKRYIDIVDPNQPTKGGPAGPPAITQVPITGFDPTDSDILLGDLAYLGPAPNIVNAVSESPNKNLVPEPSSLALCAVALLVLGLGRVKWGGRKSAAPVPRGSAAERRAA